MKKGVIVVFALVQCELQQVLGFSGDVCAK